MGETIQGRKLLKGEYYTRKYGISKSKQICWRHGDPLFVCFFDWSGVQVQKLSCMSTSIYNWFSSNAAAAATLKLVILEVFKVDVLAPLFVALLFFENDCRLCDGLILGTYIDFGCWLEFAPGNCLIYPKF